MAGEGLNTTGFTKKTMQTIQGEIGASLQSAIGPQINLLAGSVFATLRDIFAERESNLWDQLQQSYNSQYPDTATGNSLDNVAAITGTTRLAATASRVLSQIFFGTAGTIVPAGTQMAVSGNATGIFALDAAVTLVAGVNAVQTLAFSAVPDSGNFTLNFGSLSAAFAYTTTAAAIQTAVQALAGWAGVTVTGNFTTGFVFTFTGTGPTGNGLRPQALVTVTLNTLTRTSVAVTTTVTTTTAGVAQATGTCTAIATGATAAPTGTLTTIINPVSGLASVVNTVDAIPGRAIETDSALRTRRKAQLQNAGAGTIGSIQAKMLTLSGVTQAIVFENQTNAVDGNGQPAKSIQVFVQGGADADIVAALWATKPAGIQLYGTVTSSITDSTGIVRPIYYSRPTQRQIYVTVNVTKNTSWPTDGVTQVQNAILAYGLGLTVGQAVLNSSKLLPAIADAVAGIQAIAVLADFTASPAISTNLTVAVNEVAVFDTSRIVVNVT